MDIDSPSSLKRCNSAPIINDINLNTTMTTSPPTNSTSRDPSTSFNIFSANNQPRIRRFSASYSFQTHSQNPGPRLTPRVSQLRQEECIDVCNREVNHERKVHSDMQMSQSWEDLTLVTESLSCKTNEDKTPNNYIKHHQAANPLLSKMLPLNLQISNGPPICSSPSPTRPGLGRQCFSPGLHHQWKTSLSPSPTRKTSFATRRSLSPIQMRPSLFGPVKRKFELEEDNKDYLSPPTKRMYPYPQSTFTNSAYTNNIHSNLMLTTSSPIPGSISSIGTPESMSSSDSPNFTFRPVDTPPRVNSIDEPMQEERIPTSNENSSDKTETEIIMKNDS